MSWEEFLKGISILYAFGMAEKDDWELKIWYRALGGEMSVDNYEECCISLCKNNLKFWETDNIPAQLLALHEEGRLKIETKLIAQRAAEETQYRNQGIRDAINSYDSEEDRLQCIEEFKKMNRQTFRSMP